MSDAQRRAGSETTIRHRARRLLARMAAIVPIVTALLVPVGPVEPASAQGLPSIHLLCFATFAITFSPPLNLNTVTARAVGQIDNCVSPDGTAPQIRSAINFAANGTASGCSPLPLEATFGAIHITYNNGSTSGLTGRMSTNPFAMPGIILTFTSGLFDGDHGYALPLAIVPDGLCGFGGARSLSVPFGIFLLTH